MTFAGTWLLFAGPIFQAALELSDQDLERDRIRATAEKVIINQHVSPWWWLVPPVKIVLENIQQRKWRREYFSLMLPKDREAFLNYSYTASGWLIVAAGALLLALNETWSLGEAFHLPCGLCIIFRLHIISRRCYYSR